MAEKVSNEKILEAVLTLRKVCDERQHDDNSCEGCPLGNPTGGCMIAMHLPYSWQVNESFGMWRALI